MQPRYEHVCGTQQAQGLSVQNTHQFCHDDMQEQSIGFCISSFDPGYTCAPLQFFHSSTRKYELQAQKYAPQRSPVDQLRYLWRPQYELPPLHQSCDDASYTCSFSSSFGLAESSLPLFPSVTATRPWRQSSIAQRDRSDSSSDASDSDCEMKSITRNAVRARSIPSPYRCSHQADGYDSSFNRREHLRPLQSLQLPKALYAKRQSERTLLDTSCKGWTSRSEREDELLKVEASTWPQRTKVSSENEGQAEGALEA
ncbi:hypothetical protein EK21DRAFT_95006 [Setomelanomma holmii]|uniref:Uncharacterized protein n=1 Tax=Setomelanomma holmii TaxID=210430 RepID=A0A9P4GXI6_9PLEO|nr:hypothetical protein EK21DRAFT_95006 [Setomelanomma holmii]